MPQGFTALPTTGTLSGLTAVQDINTNEAALNSWHSGTSAPASPVANQMWIDTTNGLIKQYNNAANAWVIKGTMDAPMWGALLAQAVAKSAGFAVTDADNGTVFKTTGTWSLTLPQASTLKMGTGFKIAVDNGPGSGVITITPTTSTIDGAATLGLAAGDKCLIYTDGTNYFTAARFIVLTSAARGGMGLDTSGATGLPVVSAGTWSVSTTQTPQVSALGVGGAAGTANRIRLFGSTSGDQYLAAPAVANPGAVATLPSATGTLIGTGDTGTVTGAMIANATITQTQMATSSVGTAQLKTAIGSATASLGVGASGNVVMNDYAWFPMTAQTAGGANGDLKITMLNGPDASNTVGSLGLINTSGTNSATYVIRWRYATSTDHPTIYLLLDSSGTIVGVWTSDDPAPGVAQGFVIATGVTGQSVVTILPTNLDVSAAPASVVMAANAWIENMQYSISNLNYRILQQWANDMAPAVWIKQHGTWDAGANMLRFA